MVLKLYGRPQSTCTLCVAVVLHEKRVPFEFININFAVKEHKSPAYLDKQPFGQFPYIDDEGFILYESRAIARYVAAKWAGQGTPLIPTDPKELALLEQASNVEAFNFDPPAVGAAYEKIFNPSLFGIATDEARLAAHIQKVDEVIQVYDKILSKQKYVAGDKLTVVDLYHLPFGVKLSAAGSDTLTKYPNVARWWNEIVSRESWLAVEDGVKSVAAY